MRQTPYQEGHLKVSSLHEIWYAQYGNPAGVPVVVLHGGPGVGCSDEDVCFFDPSFWRIILLDQRAAKRSRPFAVMEENTTQDLIRDLEVLREAIGVDKWLLFGGSWGSALAIAYGEAYPKTILGFILRGIFLGREEELKHLWYGMRSTFPDAWQKLNDFIPVDQQHDLLTAYHRLVMDADINIALPAAKAFLAYDWTCAYLKLSAKKLKTALADERHVLGVARTFMHYAVHHFFLKKNQLLDNIGTINHLPLIVVHGRYDTITLAKSAYELHQLWPKSALILVDKAGHSAKEPAIGRSLVYATEQMKSTIGATTLQT